MSDDYRNYLLNASKAEVIHQLNAEVREPLIKAQNVVNMLLLTVNPSATMAKKIQAGEINPSELLQQLTDDITRVLDVIDFYRETLES